MQQLTARAAEMSCTVSKGERAGKALLIMAGRMSLIDKFAQRIITLLLKKKFLHSCSKERISRSVKRFLDQEPLIKF
jgi:hypothetical protein